MAMPGLPCSHPTQRQVIVVAVIRALVLWFFDAGSGTPVQLVGMKQYTVSDVGVMLTLQEAEESGYVVTSTLDLHLVTEGDTIKGAFENSRDALAALVASRRTLSKKLGQPTVYCNMSDRSVELGIQTDTLVEVVRGLAAGDQVVYR